MLATRDIVFMPYIFSSSSVRYSLFIYQNHSVSMASKEIKKGTPSENKKSEHTASEVNNKDGMVATNTSTFQPDCTLQNAAQGCCAKSTCRKF